MFLTLAVIATFAYALNSVLVAPIARRIDPLQVNAYRGLSLGISMLPVLLLLPAGSFQALNGKSLALLSGACLAATSGNISLLYGQRYLPIGVALALGLSFAALMAGLLGYFFLGEAPTLLQAVLGMLILVQAVVMGCVSKSHTFESLNFRKGLLCCVGFGLALGVGYSLIGVLSRTIHPLLVAYCWELGTGLLGFFALLACSREGRRHLKIDARQFLQIGKAASPTIVGTSCYAIATTLGPVSVVGAVLSTMGAMGAVLSYFLLKERLSRAQWVVTVGIVVTLAGLKLVSP